MSYRVIGNSCLDLTEGLKKDPYFQMVPLTLQVDDAQAIDDKAFDQKKFLAMVKVSPSCPKTVCPSPEMSKEAYECDVENIFIITLPNNLSGTYNSAVLAKGLYEEEHGKKNITVTDSWSTSSGELNIGLIVRDLCEQEIPFEEVVKKAMQYIQHEMRTYFVLESLDTPRKNGRLSGLQTFFATMLGIKSVVGADRGNITKLNQARGVNKALAGMHELAVKEAKSPETLRVIVARCNNEARAQPVKEELSKRAPFREIIVTEMVGAATMYASDGGIIFALQGFDRIWWCLE